MNRLRAFTFFSTVAALSFPIITRAADLPLLTPGWSLVPQACRTCACGFASVLGTIQNLMNAGISVSIFVAVGIMAWAGVLMITSSTNPEARGQASKMLMNAVVGMVIVLSAWMIVDFVMKVLYEGPDGQQGKFGPWNSILTGGDVCISAVETKPLFSGSIVAGTITTSTGISGGAGQTTGGSTQSMCTPAPTQSNPCSVSNMQNSCMASRGAASAATVCNFESQGGKYWVESGSDKLNNGAGPSYSVGLWQINLTQYQLEVNGRILDCPKAFSGKCTGSATGACAQRVINPGLYAQCVTAAKIASVNTKAACQLHQPNFGDWQCTASRCRIPGARAMPGMCAPGQ